MSFRFVPTQWVIENSKKIAKILKKLKNPIMASFQAKIVWKRLKKIENKNYRFVSFRSYPTGNRKFQKNSKIFKKFKNTITTSFQDKTAWKRLKKRENKNCRFVPFLHDA